MIYTTYTLAQTASLAKKLSSDYKDRGGLITIQGPLGAGKTTFTQYFAKALGIKDRIISPTFILSRQYQISDSSRTLHHLDLYRLDNVTDLKSLSLDELLSDPNNLVLIEWPEKLDSSLKGKVTTQIIIRPTAPHQRTIEVI